MTEAMRSPEYTLDSAYRAAVEAKIAITDYAEIGIKTRIHEQPHRDIGDVLGLIHQTEAGVAQAAELQEAEQALAESGGLHAVRNTGLSTVRINVSNSGVTKATVETQ